MKNKELERKSTKATETPVRLHLVCLVIILEIERQELIDGKSRNLSQRRHLQNKFAD
jgi:hypothetical protein